MQQMQWPTIRLKVQLLLPSVLPVSMRVKGLVRVPVLVLGRGLVLVLCLICHL